MKTVDYANILRRNFHGVIRDVLRDVAGRPEDFDGTGNHFRITVKSDHSGITMPEDIRRRFPDRVAFVLQNQFEILEVNEKNFAVSLAFGDRFETIVIPFDAILNFTDPYAEVSFDMKSVDEGRTIAVDASAGAEIEEADNVIRLAR